MIDRHLPSSREEASILLKRLLHHRQPPHLSARDPPGPASALGCQVPEHQLRPESLAAIQEHVARTRGDSKGVHAVSGRPIERGGLDAVGRPMSGWDKYLSETSLTAIRDHEAAQQQRDGGVGRGDTSAVEYQSASHDPSFSPRDANTWVDDLSDLSAIAVKEYLRARWQAQLE